MVSLMMRNLPVRPLGCPLRRSTSDLSTSHSNLANPEDRPYAAWTAAAAGQFIAYERALRDLVVLHCFDALKRGGILFIGTKPRTLSTITCRDKIYSRAACHILLRVTIGRLAVPIDNRLSRT